MSLAAGRPLGFAGAPFTTAWEALLGDAAAIDYRFDPSAWPADRLEQAREVWADRVRTEYRSVQIMTRFLADTLASGDPVDVHAGAADFIADELRHVGLCTGLLRAMGGQPRFPAELDWQLDSRLQQAPPPARALNTALGMLCINETISVGFIADLEARCTEPTVSAVLRATLADEDEHGEWGWTYAQKSLARFNAESMTGWRGLVRDTLAPHRRMADEILDAVPPDQRHLDAWPEPELAALGLFSPQRQALVFRRTFETALEPRLRRLELL